MTPKSTERLSNVSAMEELSQLNKELYDLQTQMLNTPKANRKGFRTRILELDERITAIKAEHEATVPDEEVTAGSPSLRETSSLKSEVENDVDRISTWGSVQASVEAMQVKLTGRWRLSPQLRTEYEISCASAPLGGWTVWRTYTDFRKLHSHMCKLGCKLPSMPPKHYFNGSGDSTVIKERLDLLPNIMAFMMELHAGNHLCFLRFVQICNDDWDQRPTSEQWADRLAELNHRLAEQSPCSQPPTPSSPAASTSPRSPDEEELSRLRAASADEKAEAMRLELARLQAEQQEAERLEAQRLEQEAQNMAAEQAAAEEKLQELDSSIIEAVQANHRQVIEAAAQTKGGPDWKKSGKSGSSECFVRNDHGKGGIVGVMGRGKIMAKRERIIEILIDPASNVVERQVVELQGCIGKLGEGADSKEVILAWTGLKCPMISNRDFCVAMLTAPVEDTGSPEEQEWIVGSVSVEHPTVEARKKYVRGELLFSGWHIKPLPEKEGKSSCGVTFVSRTAMNGSIPSALLQMGNKEGGALVNSLKKKAEK